MALNNDKNTQVNFVWVMRCAVALTWPPFKRRRRLNGVNKVHYVCEKSLNVRKRNHRTCAPSEDLDHPAHSHSLIRIFSGRILDTT